MKRTSFLRGGSCLALAIATMGAMSSGAAHAQQKSNEGSTQVEEVVVTGSFIRGTPEDAALPVDVVSAEELQKRGSPSTVELLKALSISNGVLGDTNQFDSRAQGSEGSGSVNLRGLGSQRTLVLLNGRRMAINPFGAAGAGIVDTNIIPAAAIGRLEVLKDGAAATYGSDAIAGVVNFITKKNFEGLEAGADYRQSSTARTATTAATHHRRQDLGQRQRPGQHRLAAPLQAVGRRPRLGQQVVSQQPRGRLVGGGQPFDLHPLGQHRRRHARPGLRGPGRLSRLQRPDPGLLLALHAVR
jgi:outer membrane receptor protein involved in Fe transport